MDSVLGLTESSYARDRDTQIMKAHMFETEIHKLLKLICLRQRSKNYERSYVWDRDTQIMKTHMLEREIQKL